MPSMVDRLAEMLSEKTGTKFEVRRGRNAKMQMRYGLKATREDVTYCFQAHRPMTLDELRRWLASINDMVTMGFVPVSKPGLLAVANEIIAECADARDRGEDIPDWLDMVEDHAIAARQESR